MKLPIQYVGQDDGRMDFIDAEGKLLDFEDVVDALNSRSYVNDSVSIKREDLQVALNYIQHCGANHTMRGHPHPQQWIVDKLEDVLKVSSISPSGSK